MQFILGMDDIEGTVLERRIDDVLAMGKEANQVYKPRSGGAMNKNLDKYKPEQVKLLQDVCEEYIHFFGYAKSDREDVSTPFFDYEGRAKQSSVDNINGFKELNKKAFEVRRKMAQSANKTPRQLNINTTTEPGTISMISAMEVLKMQGVIDQFSV